ncbi:Protein of unknown function (DUF1673) [Candidatus Methanoperedens nitroreducens]|uniref:DUF1673 family protein n=1 Tax=Candidatus Methanoperedens nitratireducens TaxID=1392998 RepID=A0A062V5T2_9EURY|nr:DUF1673 domain-containing protein [Candidatus Methanoperedens nitroreducens]KCZ72697.1 Protein of unknown function (DUF1673) [Candidatus Methanoperedens nitroreducens]MDJ1423370.1 DUF1673 domain-containing protein [Candidatus Methanoperedens sp.]
MKTFSENIRKIMGWCPNAGALTIRKSVQFDDLAVNAPDSGGELTHITAGWWNKYHNRILFNSVIATLGAIYFFTLSGKDNMNFFLAGLIAGIISSIVFGITEWRRLNKAAAGEFRELQITRRKKVINYIIIFGSIAVIIFVIVFFRVKTGIRISGYYAFISGLFLFVWTQYLEVVYWERKNRKTLIVEKTSFYAVDTGGRK